MNHKIYKNTIMKGVHGMFCHKCGTQLPEDTAFCFKCGANVTSQEVNNHVEQIKAQQPVTVTAESVYEPNINNKTFNKKAIIIATVIGITVIVALVVVFIFLSDALRPRNQDHVHSDWQPQTTAPRVPQRVRDVQEGEFSDFSGITIGEAF